MALIDLVIDMFTQAEAIRQLMMVKYILNLLCSQAQDMLDLKMIKENTFKIDKKVFDPNETIKTIMDMFLCYAKQRNIELSFKTVQVDTLENNTS